MLRCFFSAISGLYNNQTWIDVIANNITNMNTPGYKGQRATFQEVYNQTLKGASPPVAERGGTNPRQIGLGAFIAAIETDHRQGNLQTTNKLTDLAIQGDGYFVLTDKRQQFFTRCGTFDFDSKGNFVSLVNGLFVMGWEAEKREDGHLVIDTTKALGAINVEKFKTVPAVATTKVTLSGNLDAKIKNAIESITLALKKSVQVNGGWKEYQKDVQILFSRLFYPKESQRLFFRWRVVDPLTYQTLDDAKGIIEVNKDGKVIMSRSATLVDEDFVLTEQEVSALEGGDDLPSVTAGVDFGDGETTNVEILVARIEGEDGAPSLTNPKDIIFDPKDVAQPYKLYAPPKTAKLEEEKDYIHKASIAVYDSMGQEWMLAFTFQRVGTNRWLFYVPNPTDKMAKKIASYGIICFDKSGLYNAGESKIYPSPSDPEGEFQGIYFDPPQPNAAPPAQKGAGTLKISMNLSRITQYATGVSTADVVEQNGYPSGILQGIAISEKGVILAQYDNGRTVEIAQVALALFANPAGLTRKEGGLFLPSANSGLPQIGEAQKGKRGTILAGTLETSNVNLTEEFTNMIIAQRSFQANSRTILTGESLIREVLALRR